jgi:F-type H+-transporting ATPase subunit b
MTLPSLFASHGGFGLNLNVFETNVINLAIVIFGLYKFLPNFLGGILERRRAIILADLKDAEERLATATSSLSQAQKDLADAQQKAEQIRADGNRLESEKRTVEEMARVKQGAAADLSAEASRVSNLLRREAAQLAIEKALASLPGKLDADAQAKLVNQSIKTLGNV